MLYRHRGHHAEKQRRRLAAQCATAADKGAAIRDYLVLLAPHRRSAALLSLIKDETFEVFWPAFIYNWTDCDKGSTNRLLLKVLRRVGPCPWLHASFQIALPASYYEYARGGGEFFRSLPDPVTVYRGASRARIAGLSWTSTLSVAWRFARGHRGIRVPDPVIATGTISKSDIWWATDCRNEQEILGVPRDIKVEDFQPQQFKAQVGWLIVDSILDNHLSAWSGEEYAYVGLKDVGPMTIAYAHFLAVKRLGYTPERVQVGRVMEAPADVNYWGAVLAAVPAASRDTDGALLGKFRSEWRAVIEAADADADAHYASLDDDAVGWLRYQYEKED